MTYLKYPFLLTLLALFLAGEASANVPTTNGLLWPFGNRTNTNSWAIRQDFDVFNSDFGSQHLGEDWNWGAGNDDCGEPLYSASDGVVIEARDFGSGWGNVVIVRFRIVTSQFPNGVELEFLYGHLNTLYVAKDEIVQKGQEIGTLGDRSPSNGCMDEVLPNTAHLHLELRDANSSAWGTAGPGYSNNLTGWNRPSAWIADNLSTTTPTPACTPLPRISIFNQNLDGWEVRNAPTPGYGYDNPSPNVFWLVMEPGELYSPWYCGSSSDKLILRMRANHTAGGLARIYYASGAAPFALGSSAEIAFLNSENEYVWKLEDWSSLDPSSDFRFRFDTPSVGQTFIDFIHVGEDTVGPPQVSLSVEEQSSGFDGAIELRMLANDDNLAASPQIIGAGVQFFEVRVRTNGNWGPWETHNAPQGFPSIKRIPLQTGPGSYRAEMRAVDFLGNTSAQTAQVNWTVLATPTATPIPTATPRLTVTPTSSPTPVPSTATPTSTPTPTFTPMRTPSGGMAPDICWSRVFGGSAEPTSVSRFSDVASTREGHLLAVGRTDRPSFLGVQVNGGLDGALVKLDSAGNLLWRAVVGGGGDDVLTGVTVDHNGCIIVCGHTESTLLLGETTLASPGNSDLFVAKYSKEGVLRWMTTLGDDGDEFGAQIGVDATNTVFLVGMTRSANFNGTPTAGGQDLVVAKVSASGQILQNRVLGGRGDELHNGIAISPDGGMFVAGETRSSDFLDLRNLGADADSVFFSLDSNLQLVWSDAFDVPGLDSGRGITLAQDGSVYGCGYSVSSIDSSLSYGGDDAFLVKYDPMGTRLWARTLGGDSRDRAWGVTVSSDDKVIIVGETGSSALGGWPALGGQDVFVAAYGSDGAFSWSRRFGGAETDEAFDVTHINGEVYVAGQTGSSGILGHWGGGATDALVMKLCDSMALVTPSPTPAVPLIPCVIPMSKSFGLGWQTVGFSHPLAGSNIASDVLTSIEASGIDILLVAQYQEGNWSIHMAGRPLADFTLQPQGALWVFIQAGGTWNYELDACAPGVNSGP